MLGTNITFKHNRQCLWLKENGLTLWLWDQAVTHQKNTGIQYSQSWNHFLTPGLYQNFHTLCKIWAPKDKCLHV